MEAGDRRSEMHMRIGKYDFDVSHHTYVMGILNVTPDSFSDGGGSTPWIRPCFTHSRWWRRERIF